MVNPVAELRAARAAGLPTGPLEQPVQYYATPTGNYHATKRCRAITKGPRARLELVDVLIDDMKPAKLCKSCALRLPEPALSYSIWLIGARKVIEALHRGGVDPGLGKPMPCTAPTLPLEDDDNAARLALAVRITQHMRVPESIDDRETVLRVHEQLCETVTRAAAVAQERARARYWRDEAHPGHGPRVIIAFPWYWRNPDMNYLRNEDKALVRLDLAVDDDANLGFAIGRVNDTIWVRGAHRLDDAGPTDTVETLRTACRIAGQLRANDPHAPMPKEQALTALEAARGIHHPVPVAR